MGDAESDGTPTLKSSKRNATSPKESAAKKPHHISVLDAAEMTNTPVSGADNTTGLAKLYDLYTKLEARVRVIETDRNLLEQTLKDKNAELLSVRLENADLQGQLSRVVPPQTPPPGSLDPLNGTLVSDGAPPAMETTVGNLPAEEISSEVAALHEADLKRAKKLSYILNTLKNLPDHVYTLLIGDSNTHKVRGKDVDSWSNSVCVRSCSGLCIYSAAHALSKYKHQYPRIRKVIYCLGVNDALHGDQQHCQEDQDEQVKSLITETSRIFPNAQVHFILPFTGVKAVTPSFRRDLENRIKEKTPDVKVHFPPNMSKMLRADGVHLNSEGKQAYITFLSQRFSKPKPKRPSAPVTVSAADNPPSQDNQIHAGDHQHRWESFRLPPSSQRATHPTEFRAREPFPDFSELARGISDAVKHTMQSWSSLQLRQQAGHYQQWPPL